MPKRLNLVGQKFGRLTVISINEEKTKEKGKAYWNCKCECGNFCCVGGHDLKTGNTQSCGCIHTEQLRERSIKHNLRHTKIYGRWLTMRSRCNNPNFPKYKDYGARGIKVCREWDDFKAFYDWAMNNGYSDDLTIDRIYVNGNYEPSNCRWVNAKVQANNQRRNIRLNINGVEKTLMEWYEDLKPSVSYDRALARFHREGFISVEQLFGDRRVA